MSQTWEKTRRQGEGEARRTFRQQSRRDFSWSPGLPVSLSSFRAIWLAIAAFGAVVVTTAPAGAQPPTIRYGEAVPRDVREMYERGLQYLANTQTESGNWTGGDTGPGGTGLGLMVFLASGEDP